MNTLGEPSAFARNDEHMTETAEDIPQGDIFSIFSEIYDREKRQDMTLQDYLEGCRDDPSMYATAAERMVTAIGEPNWSTPAPIRGSAGSS